MEQRILLTFDCDHPAIVIGKEGKTLEAIQYLCTLSLSRHFDKPISVITDTQNYWRKAEDKINAEIERGIGFIEAGNSIYRFRPMNAQLRRYIHRALEGHATVATSSEGEGKWRKVTLRRKTQEEASQAVASSAAAAQTLQEAQEEQNLQSYAESSSCCAGEESSCSCGQDCCCAQPQQAASAQQPYQAEQPVCAEQAVVQTVTYTQTTLQVSTEPASAEVPSKQDAAQPAAACVREELSQSAAEQPQQPAQEKADSSCGPLFAAAPSEEEQPK